MGSEMWGKKFARSPRQDRRVIEDGKFVELGKVQHPEPPKEEEPVVNTALEHVAVITPPEAQAVLADPKATPEQIEKAHEMTYEIPCEHMSSEEEPFPEATRYDAMQAIDRADAEAQDET